MKFARRAWTVLLGFLAVATVVLAGNAIAQPGSERPNSAVCWKPASVFQTPCPVGFSPAFYNPDRDGYWINFSLDTNAYPYPPSCRNGADVNIPCPTGMAPGNYWLISNGQWELMTPLYASGPSTTPAPLNCQAHPERCVAHLPPCPPLVVPGGNPSFPQVSNSNQANVPCTRTPSPSRTIATPPVVQVAPKVFCKAHPDECVPPAGERLSFCLIHPEQCSIRDAGHVQPDNPAARDQLGR